MNCYVYESRKRPGTYLYLTERDDFSRVPEALLKVFGPPRFALAFEFTENRTLAREDPATVRRNLLEQGFHLQLPPQDVDRA